MIAKHTEVVDVQASSHVKVRTTSSASRALLSLIMAVQITDISVMASAERPRIQYEHIVDGEKKVAR